MNTESLLLVDLLDLLPLGLLPRWPESTDSDLRPLELWSLERRSLERRPFDLSQDCLDLDLDLEGDLLAQDLALALTDNLDFDLSQGALDLDLLAGDLDPDLLAGDLDRGLTFVPLPGALGSMALTLALALKSVLGLPLSSPKSLCPFHSHQRRRSQIQATSSAEK